VQDAGHELRTPLTSIRANVDVLRRHPTLDTATRDAVLDDLRSETAELGSLVDEIVTAASGEAELERSVPFDLGDAVTEVARRYERRTGRPVVVDAESSPVVGQRGGVQRAVSCLLDNARKFDGSAEPIEVTVGGHTVVVADRGPGIEEAELALVFDRFHRADDARSMPGSGLGLSIVRDVALRHGGDTFARNRTSGGAEVGFTIPAAPAAVGLSPDSHPDGQ
jgi:two-component system sensor histidine kinase MprB